MSIIPRVTKVSVAPLFWADLRDWRRSPDYAKLRSSIARFVQLNAQGLPAGDQPFIGNKAVWKGISHAHVGFKLTLFVTRPAPDEVRLCCVKKHSFYGYGSERKSQKTHAPKIVGSAAEAEHQSRPNWPSLKWKEPADILVHPELRELSDKGLSDLCQEIEHEMDTLERFERSMQGSGLSLRLQDKILDAWAHDLKSSLSSVDTQIALNARRQKPYLVPESQDVWLPSSNELPDLTL